MGKCPFIILSILLILSACTGDITPDRRGDGPLLLSDVTLPPSTLGIPPVTSVATATFIRITPEVVSPLDNSTLEADFLLVTPTLPPSKTPSQTPTQTITPPPSNTPTVTVTSTQTIPILPTSLIIPITGVAVQPLAEVCDSTWFFIQPRPQSCPTNPPLADQAVFQQFENGYMIWVRRPDAIYVMYNDGIVPRWEVYRDYFNEGMNQDFIGSPPANRWEPVRGFGLLWRNNSAVRSRIGWATQQYETPYSVQLQLSKDGAIFVNEPSGNIFGLTADKTNWALYTGQ